MINKIKNYIEYKKKIKLLKMYAVNQITNIVVNNAEYINGFQKLLLAASGANDADKLKELVKEFDVLTKGKK